MNDVHIKTIFQSYERMIRRFFVGVVVLFGVPVCGLVSASELTDLFREAAPGSAQTVDHSEWDRLLKAYVKPGADGLNRVDYSAFKRDGHEDLKLYIQRLEAVDPQTLNRREQFAFLVNLYNAKTIDVILDNYPVKSIKDISLGGGLVALVTGGPRKAKILEVKGVELSLDDIEHGLLRALFKDPRFHYAVNCASIGCPNLQSEAFTGGKLDAQLDVAARAYVNHPRGVTVGSNGVTVSSIYNWFKADFGGNDEGVLKHLRAYAAPDVRTKFEAVKSISGDAYDLGLNDLQR
jgi:hypothetical protein